MRLLRFKFKKVIRKIVKMLIQKLFYPNGEQVALIVDTKHVWQSYPWPAHEWLPIDPRLVSMHPIPGDVEIEQKEI